MESPQAKTNTNLLNETEAAEYLGLSVRTLQAWRVRGGKIGFVRLGRSVRYRPQDLEDWVNSNRLTSTSQVGGQRMRPLKTSIFSPALAALIQLTDIIRGKEMPQAESIPSTLTGCGAVEVWAIPKEPEPGLDRVLIARIELEGHPSCQ